MQELELDELIDKVAKARGVELEQMSEFARREFVMEVTLEIELTRRAGLLSGPAITFDLGGIKREFPSLRFLAKELEEKI
ncbi:hypothetical protein ES706_03736 [subsurface metagenome]